MIFVTYVCQTTIGGQGVLGFGFVFPPTLLLSNFLIFEPLCSCLCISNFNTLFCERHYKLVKL